MNITGRTICEFLDESGETYEFIGNLNLEIRGFCSLNRMKEFCITWAKSSDKLSAYHNFIAKNCIIVMDADPDFKCLEEKENYILCDEPKKIFFLILTYFFENVQKPQIARDSIIHTSVIGKNVAIGHGCFIGANVKIADNVTIGNNVLIECPTTIGSNSIIHSGTVIGTDGFGYYKDKEEYKKVPHFGGVNIGKNVEIGANTCIDRGTLDDTIIENGSKIDNLCHIAHNVYIGENAMVIALSLLGGSSRLEKNAYMAPGSILKNQIIVGENSLVGMGSVVIHNVEANKVVVGTPARIIRENS